MEKCSTLEDGELARRIAVMPPGAASSEESELCRRFANRVRAYCMRRLRDHQEAADLVQRVLMLTLEKLRAGSVREPDRIGSFVLGAARILVRESHRRARPEEPIPEDRGRFLTAPGSQADPLAVERLKGCLESLAERERTVVVLTYYAEQNSKQIADALGLSEGNVRVIRYRAMGFLRDCMGLAGRL